MSGFLDYSSSSSLFLPPKLNYWITLHQLHCHLCYYYQGQIIGIKNTLCDDYKLFESSIRVIWGTACEQQHKSVPILYLMVITMKHRKNAKKTWFLTIINFDDNLTAICCVFVKWDRGLLSNIQRLLLSEIATWQTFCSKLKTQRRPTIQIQSSDYANKDVKI